jgi:hypothetical protein
MPTKLTSEILTAALAGFEEQEKRIDAKIAGLRQMLTGGSPDGAIPEPSKPRRKMSAAARRRIAAAQRKRWAASRNQSGKASGAVPAPARRKRKLSAAGKRRIIEATKRRWAAFHAAAQKTVKRRER